MEQWNTRRHDERKKKKFHVPATLPRAGVPFSCELVPVCRGGLPGYVRRFRPVRTRNNRGWMKESRNELWGIAVVVLF